MAAIDLITALGRLLSDPGLRLQFRDNPGAVAEQMNVMVVDRASLVCIDHDRLECQARTLLHKRWRAVAELLPETLNQLGDEAVEVFRFYAVHEWPQGSQRHIVDALRFAAFLKANRLARPVGKEVKQLVSMSTGTALGRKNIGVVDKSWRSLS